MHVIFDTEDGRYFRCKTKEIPWQIQNAFDSDGTVKAEVGDPDDWALNRTETEARSNSGQNLRGKTASLPAPCFSPRSKR
jgi:hypothetical protein